MEVITVSFLGVREMRRIFLISLLLLVFMVSVASAWQPRKATDATTPANIFFYSLTAIRDGADGVESFQIKNDGSGTLTISLWRYISGSEIIPVQPYKAAAGFEYSVLVDSTYTLAAGETLFIENMASNRKPHWAHIKRPVSTSFTVLWK